MDARDRVMSDMLECLFDLQSLVGKSGHEAYPSVQYVDLNLRLERLRREMIDLGIVRIDTWQDEYIRELQAEGKLRADQDPR